jgi:FKBP-type peptidyl-prolyl cis-trans isomerase
VIYFGKLKDGTVFERKGSNEEPFEFTTLEGALCYSSALLFGMSI